MSSALESHHEPSSPNSASVKDHNHGIRTEIDDNKPFDMIDAANDNEHCVVQAAEESSDIIVAPKDNDLPLGVDKSCAEPDEADNEAQAAPSDEGGLDVASGLDAANAADINVIESPAMSQSFSDILAEASPTQIVDDGEVSDRAPTREAAVVSQAEPAQVTKVTAVNDTQAKQTDEINPVNNNQPDGIAQAANGPSTNDQASGSADAGRVLGPSRRRYKDYVSVADRRKAFTGK